MDEKLRDAISKDGYGLESELRTKLETLGWKVRPKERYVDVASKKDRTIDLIATKRYPRARNQGGEVGVQLVIECKWRNSTPTNAANTAIYTESRNDDEIIRRICSQYDFDETENWGISRHHYLDKTIPLVLHHVPDGDHLYAGLEQAVHAWHYFSSIQFFEPRVETLFEFPVVVTNGSGRVFFADTEAEHTQRFQHLYPHTTGGVRHPIIVDVVPLDDFDNYISSIDADVMEFLTIDNFRRMQNENRYRAQESEEQTDFR